MYIFDLHCDTLLKLVNDPNPNLYNNNFMVSIDKMIKSNYLAQCFACFIDLKKDDVVKEVLKMIDMFYLQISKHNDFIEVALNYDNIIANQNNNKISAILTIEEGGALLGSIELLRMYYKLGVRMITLTWNYQNEIASPAYFVNDLPKADVGLTDFGKEVVKVMNDLNMIIDVSHMSDKGFYDVLKYSKQPVVASHSNSRMIHNHLRNLTDDMIIKLDKAKGLLGINYYSNFISNKGFSYVEDVVKHIKHIKNVASIDVIALGSDFDGIPDNLQINDCSKVNLLVKELEKEEFTKDEIEKILYKNALRVFQKILG